MLEALKGAHKPAQMLPIREYQWCSAVMIIYLYNYLCHDTDIEIDIKIS